MYVMQITGTSENERQQHTAATTAAGQRVAATAANTANATGQMHTNEGARTRTRECERGRASANEGGGATVAAAATAGPPPPLFIYLILVF